MESAGQEVSGEVYASQVKLFGKWNCDEVDVDDISLKVILRNLIFLKIFYEDNLFFHQIRITYQSKVKPLSIFHTQLAVTKSSASARPCAQSSSACAAH